MCGGGPGLGGGVLRQDCIYLSWTKCGRFSKPEVRWKSVVKLGCELIEPGILFSWPRAGNQPRLYVHLCVCACVCVCMCTYMCARIKPHTTTTPIAWNRGRDAWFMYLIRCPDLLYNMSGLSHSFDSLNQFGGKQFSPGLGSIFGHFKDVLDPNCLFASLSHSAMSLLRCCQTPVSFYYY